MQEQGVVTKVLSAGRVEVALQATEACSRCGACHRKEDGQVTIEAVGPDHLVCGDGVEIEISTERVVAASFVVYLVPVLFLIAGYGIGSWLAGVGGIEHQTAGIIGALVFLALSFLVVRRYDDKERQKAALQAKVTRVISHD